MLEGQVILLLDKIHELLTNWFGELDHPSSPLRYNGDGVSPACQIS